MNAEQLRELDAWIAEHVMGWEWWRFDAPAILSSTRREKWCQLIPPNEEWPLKKTDWRGVKCKCAIEGMEDFTDLSTFKPTTDPAAAMMVLAKCCTRACVMVWHSESAGSWYCNRTSGGENLGQADTLPTAICKFAKNLYEQQTKQKP